MEEVDKFKYLGVIDRDMGEYVPHMLLEERKVWEDDGLSVEREHDT